MPTLPLKSSLNGWNEAIAIHASRFSRSISRILRIASLCSNRSYLTVLFAGLIGEDSKDVLDAMLSPIGRQYLSILRKYDRRESLVVARPNLLIALVKEIVETFGREFYTGKGFLLCNKFLKAVFEYGSFVAGKALVIDISDKKKVCWKDSKDLPRWDTAMLIRKMGIRYCPYCNAETIYAVPKDDSREDIRYRSAMDHFLPKDKYPFLGLSLYNLVPSCTRCNTSYKQNKDPLALWQCDVLPRDGHDIDIFRAAHPYVENVYDKFSMRFVLRDGKLTLKYRAGRSDWLSRSRVLMEDMFRWSQTYTELFMPEALAVATNIQKMRPIYRHMLNNAYGRFPILSLDKLVCGFDVAQDDFMNHRLGKLKVDLFNKYASSCI